MLQDLMPSDYVEFGRHLYNLRLRRPPQPGRQRQRPRAHKVADVITKAQVRQQFHRANVSINSPVTGSLCKRQDTALRSDMAVDFYAGGRPPPPMTHYRAEHRHGVRDIRIFNSPYYDLVMLGR